MMDRLSRIISVRLALHATMTSSNVCLVPHHLHLNAGCDSADCSDRPVEPDSVEEDRGHFFSHLPCSLIPVPHRRGLFDIVLLQNRKDMVSADGNACGNGNIALN